MIACAVMVIFKDTLFLGAKICLGRDWWKIFR